jgi:hypothetical protein
LNRYGYEGKEQEMGFGKIPTDGLVSYYSFEGGGFDDGKGNQGRVVNASLTTGKVRDGYSFDGVGDFIAVNDSSSLDITGNLTLSAWIYPIENQVGYVVAKYQSYMIHLTGNPLVAQGGIWVGGNWNPLATTTSIPMNKWSHVVFTYNKSSARIYLNGTLSGSGTNSNSIDARNQILCIGAKNSTVRDRDFNGSIDEVGVWNRALSSSEVREIYNYGSQFESGYRTTDFNARRFNLNTVLPEQPDSIISQLYNPQSLNRFMVELGNPYKYNDPSGHIIIPTPKVLDDIKKKVNDVLKKVEETVKSMFIKPLEQSGTDIGKANKDAAQYILGGGPKSGVSTEQLCMSIGKATVGAAVVALFFYGATSGMNGGSVANEGRMGASQQASFRNEKMLSSHFESHGSQLGYTAAQDYESGAGSFLTGKPGPFTAEMIRPSDGALVRYELTSGKFGVLAADGTTIKTFMKPDSNLVNSYNYYLRQILR